MSDILVIGYGNELRSDDAIGPRVAEAVGLAGLPRVRSFAVHQLTPELSEPIAAARAVIFVDATVDTAAKGVFVRSIQSNGSSGVVAHISDPRGLLALALAVFGRLPPAWLVTVPAASFELGNQLSPLARNGISTALREIQKLCRTLPAC